MIKKILLFIVLLLLFTNSVYSNYEIIDSGDTYSNITEIDKIIGELIFDTGYIGNKYIDLGDVDITGNYPGGNFNDKVKTKLLNKNYEYITVLGYQGNNFSYSGVLDISNNYPGGNFNGKVKTKILNKDYEYITGLGYQGNNYSYTGILDITNNYPGGNFNDKIKTKILDNNFVYNFYTGYIGDLKIKSGGSNKNVVQTITYRKFFEELFSQNINLIGGSYNRYDKSLFIKNILDLSFDSTEYYDEIIDLESQQRVRSEVTNSNFKTNLKKLVNNLKGINKAFGKARDEQEKFYIIKYYLDE